MKRFCALLLSFVLILSLSPAAAAASSEATAAADKLYSLGLFQGKGYTAGGSPIYALDDLPSRQEAVTMLVRLLGKETEAKAGKWNIPFTDVDAWAVPYVGYAYANGLTAGTGPTTFSGSANVNAAQYLTFVLRALGYSSDTDFQWNSPWMLSDRLGFTDGRFHSGSTAFTRGDIAVISAAALEAKLKNSGDSLLASLEKVGAISAAPPTVLPTPVDRLTFNLTAGSPAEAAQPILFRSHQNIPPEDACVHSCTRQALGNGYTRIRILYTMPYDLSLYVANRPNYSIFNAKPGITTGRCSELVFDIKNSVLGKCDTIMCMFDSGTPDYRFVVYLSVGDQAGFPLTAGVPAGEARTVAFSGSPVSGCTAQPLDNGYTRITVEHTAPGGFVLQAHGNGWLFSDERGTSGAPSSVAFDVKNEELANTASILFTFFADGIHRTSHMTTLFINGQATGAPAGQTTISLTDGVPVGKAKEVAFRATDELAAGTGQIHQVTAQELDNGCTRFAVDYTVPQGLRIFVFDPPNGETVGLWGSGTTTGLRDTLVFDVETVLLEDSEGLTVNFFRSGNDRYLVFLPFKR